MKFQIIFLLFAIVVATVLAAPAEGDKGKK